MENTDLKKLYFRLMALTVFRELLKDDVLKALCEYLYYVKNGEVTSSVSAYAEFVSCIFKTASANLTLHIKDITENSENVYIRSVASGKKIDSCMQNAVNEELKTLQAVSNLKRSELLQELAEKEFLPDFPSFEADIQKSFMHRAENVSKYGYGAYAKNAMFYINSNGFIVPVKNPDSISLQSLIDYERERKIILDNTYALLSDKPAANILLTGDAGTGKSSTVKAVVNKLFSEGLRILEVRKEQLRQIPEILDELSENPLKFILFIDDISFKNDDDNFNALKAVLEGSVSAKSKNVVIYATSNRRHIVKERFSDREGDDIHRNDSMQEMISLSNRFGIHISFSKPDKKTFLNIVRHLAEEENINMPFEEIEQSAERFALERGGRSARLARQFIDGLLAK